MAYSEGGSRFWNVDLTTRAGAIGAARMGGIVCFVFAGMAVLGIFVFGGLMAQNDVERLGGLIGGGMEVALGLIAGFRLRAGKGAYWGIAAAVLLALEIVAKVTYFSIGGIIINGIMLVILVNGIRGAFVLKSNVGFEDDDVEVFN